MTLHVWNTIRESIFKVIDNDGFILMYDLPPLMTNEIFRLVDEGTLIQLHKLPATSDFMNASYMATYADDRFKLSVENNGDTSSIVKANLPCYIIDDGVSKYSIFNISLVMPDGTVIRSTSTYDTVERADEELSHILNQFDELKGFISHN